MSSSAPASEAQSEHELKALRALKYSAPAAALARCYYALRTRTVERLIFTATTGRSGTLTLTRIFAGIPGCRALHEPHPVMNDAALRAASYGDNDALDRLYRTKSINILRAAAGYRYYLEANHLFIKSFVAHASRDFGNRLAVIHLVRPPLEVASSIYRLHRQPGTESGNRWWLDYRAPLNRIRIADALEGEFSHPFYKGLWYWFEIETRVQEWRQRLVHVPFVRFETDWFNQPHRLATLTRELGIVVDRRQIDSLVGVKEHTREHLKIAPLQPDEAQRMFEQFVALLQQRCPAAVATVHGIG
jgi:hypothetical protein